MKRTKVIASMLAIILAVSILGTINPGIMAAADSHEDEEEVNDEHEEEDNLGSSDDDTNDNESEDSSGSGDDEHEANSIVQQIGEHSEATIQQNGEIELEVEIEEGDLPDGVYDVKFTCDSPEVSEEFSDALEVTEGSGEFATELDLAEGTYSGCEVSAGELSAEFSEINIVARTEEEDDEENDEVDEEKEDDDHDENSSDFAGENKEESIGEHESESKTKVAVEDDGLEIELEFKGLDLADGTYTATLVCADPAIDMNLEDSFEVEDKAGELEADLALEAGTYSDCELQIQDTDITVDAGSFVITGEDDEQTIESRQDRKKELVENHNAQAIHDRHRSSQAASPGEYEPGAGYTLMLTGLADDGTTIEDATVEANLGVWKSVRSLVLFDVLDGNVVAGDKEYTIQLGYAIYSNHGDVLRLRALATDDATGEVVRLSLRGLADEMTELPTDSGDSVDLLFDGNSGMIRNEIDGWELIAEGSLQAE